MPARTQAYAAIVLAGGAGQRFGGPAKPMAPVAGTPMLARVLGAVADADPLIVVGPAGLPAPPDTVFVHERPAGGGPAAATAAGLAELPADAGFVALLAADLPLLTRAAVDRLRRATTDAYDGAVYVDDGGQRQWLCGLWRVTALRAARSALPEKLTGTPLRRLLAPLRVAEVTAPGHEPPPWWDCDTEADRRRAEELANVEPADGAGPAG
ncbi:NTP transferase domain-containing protein [Natronosporangium hydrolyticum]|uniref:NTP transferase domain-containing protein n=1 Tax=Natronosporangium hydrolyticum TaxID=2811111 RepID=A0A895YH93_9ACTN|nr:NTP transferase domain-containing protein [Natronosporangium hydrolyticum]QSB14889.1 NTP transferase domain-containing protein [Natronosporangium hydrolyticum]